LGSIFTKEKEKKKVLDVGAIQNLETAYWKSISDE
jgi:hypothetical protein